MPYFLTFLIILLTIALLWQIYDNQKKKKALQTIKAKVLELLQSDCKNDNLSVDSSSSLLLTELETMFHNQLCLIAEYSKKERAVDKAISLHSKELLAATLSTLEELSAEEKISFEVQKKLYRCHTNVEKVKTLLHKLYTSFLLEHQEKIAKCVLNVNEICHNNILNFYDEISGKGIEVQIDIPKEPILLTSNKEILSRILSIIILNLISHSENHTVIGLTLDNDENYVFIELWDHAAGETSKPEGNLSRCLLSPECQLKNQESDLYIARQLVRALGGELSLSNNDSFQETSFMVKLEKVS